MYLFIATGLVLYLAIVNSAAINMDVLVSLRCADLESLRIYQFACVPVHVLVHANCLRPSIPHRPQDFRQVIFPE